MQIEHKDSGEVVLTITVTASDVNMYKVLAEAQVEQAMPNKKVKLSAEGKKQYVRSRIFGKAIDEMQTALDGFTKTDEDLDREADKKKKDLDEQKADVDTAYAKLKAGRPEIKGEI